MLGDVRAQFYALTFFTTIPVLFRLSPLVAGMGYIPQHALANLRNYSYKGVDKCVYQSHYLPFLC